MCPSSGQHHEPPRPPSFRLRPVFSIGFALHPAPRAHVGAAPRADARTPLPHHADVIVASAIRRVTFHAVPVGRRSALDGVRRVGVDADHPVRQGLARDVDGNGVGVGQLSGNNRQGQVPQHSLDDILPPDARDGRQASVAPEAVQDGLLKAVSQQLRAGHVGYARPPGQLARVWCNRFG